MPNLAIFFIVATIMTIVTTIIASKILLSSRQYRDKPLSTCKALQSLFTPNELEQKFPPFPFFCYLKTGIYFFPIRRYSILTINEPMHWWIVTWLGNRRLTVLNFFPFKTIWSIMTSIVGWGWHMALIPIMAHACLAVQFSSGNWKQFTTKNISKLK